MTKRNIPARYAQKHLAPGLIEQYLFGKLPERARNRVERHLVECDLCSDAVEGLSEQSNSAKTILALEELRLRVDKRVNGRRFVLPFGIQPFAVAASIILLLSSTLAVWLTMHYQEKEVAGQRVAPMAQLEPKPVPPETSVFPGPAAPTSIPAQPSGRPSLSKAESDYNSAGKQSLMDRPAPTGKKTENIARPAYTEPVASAKPKKQAVEQKRANDSAIVRQQPEPVSMQSKEPLLASKDALYGGKEVKGRVVDAEGGMALPGVRVIVKGSDKSVLTDTNGQFTIQAPDTARLVFQFIGMIPVEQPVASAGALQVTMEADRQALNEVVVVGYGAPGSPEEAFRNATPQGGMNQFSRYVRENLRLPDSVKTQKKEAVVKLECVVLPDGSLTNFTIKKGAGDAFDREAIRVIKEGPRWEPARQDGKAVPSRVTVKVPFKD